MNNINRLQEPFQELALDMLQIRFIDLPDCKYYHYYPA